MPSFLVFIYLFISERERKSIQKGSISNDKNIERKKKVTQNYIILSGKYYETILRHISCKGIWFFWVKSNEAIANDLMVY